MRLARLPVVAQLLCIVVVLIILSTLWPSLSKQSLSFRFVSEPVLFVFPVFNIIVLAVVARSRWLSAEEVWRVSNISNFLACTPPDELGNDKHDETPSEDSDTSKDSSSEEEYDDDDENGSGLQCLDQDHELGGSLEKRIEDFINKVNKGWREERLKENLYNDLQFAVSALV